MFKSELLELLTTHFSRQELKTLCFELGVDDESWPDGGKAGMARELLGWVARNGRFPLLLQKCLALRPDVVWPELPDDDERVFVVDDELRPYLQAVVRRTSRLPLGPLDPSGRDSAHISLAQVFVNLEVNYRDDKWFSPGPEPHQRILSRFSTAIAYVHERDQLILLGDPGSGKSTLLRFLAHCLAQATLHPDAGWLEKLQWQEEQQLVKAALKPSQIIIYGDYEELEEPKIARGHWIAGPYIPLYIELRDFARSPFSTGSPLALWQFVCTRLEKNGFQKSLEPLEELAKQGNLIFLLDGVDEVPPNQRADVWQTIAALADGPYGNNRWVATCRVLSFNHREAPSGVNNLTLQPLDIDQIHQFIQNWHAALAEGGEMGPGSPKRMSWSRS